MLSWLTMDRSQMIFHNRNNTFFSIYLRIIDFQMTISSMAVSRYQFYSNVLINYSTTVQLLKDGKKNSLDQV